MVELQDGFAWVARFRLQGGCVLIPDHQLRELLGGGACHRTLRHHAPVSQHGDERRGRGDLAQPVGDEDDRVPVGGQSL